MTTPAEAFLVIHTPEGERSVPIGSGYSWSIGRGQNNQVVLADSRISRQHALVQRTETGDYFLIDMGSRNGSFINESRVSTPVPLKDGDRLSLGGCTIVFKHPGSSSASAYPAGTDMEATQAWFVQELVTVLVVDVGDFTRMAQRLEQSLLCRSIGTWFRLANEILTEHGCSTLKYIGDAVMAVWVHTDGVRLDRELARILNALLEFADATAALEREHSLPVPMRIGAGVNTGLASVGNAGTRSVFDYTALGDPVNTAFRLESATKEIDADVALGPAAIDALRHYAHAEAHFATRSVTLKGYDAPMLVSAATFDSLRRFVEDCEARA